MSCYCPKKAVHAERTDVIVALNLYWRRAPYLKFSDIAPYQLLLWLPAPKKARKERALKQSVSASKSRSLKAEMSWLPQEDCGHTDQDEPSGSQARTPVTLTVTVSSPIEYSSDTSYGPAAA